MKGDCFGLCFCKSDSILCCRGHFLTKKQKQFIGLQTDKKDESNKADNSVGDSEYASAVEKFIGMIYAEKLLTKSSRIVVLVVWAIAVLVAIYGILQIRTEFSMELFVPAGSLTDKYLQMDLRTFKTGFNVDVIVENPDVDYSSEE